MGSSSTSFSPLAAPPGLVIWDDDVRLLHHLQEWSWSTVNDCAFSPVLTCGEVSYCRLGPRGDQTHPWQRVVVLAHGRLLRFQAARAGRPDL